MSLHAVIYTYTDQADELAALRPAHREFLHGLNARGALLASGPLANGAGDTIGALILMDTGTAEDAARLLDADPFATAGLIANRDIKPWTVVVGSVGT